MADEGGGDAENEDGENDDRMGVRSDIDGSIQERGVEEAFEN